MAANAPTKLTFDAIRMASGPALHKYPHLPRACANFAERLAQDMGGLAAAAIRIGLEGLDDSSAQGKPPPPFHAAFTTLLHAHAPPFHIHFAADRQLVFALCDVAFGGCGNEPPHQEDRPLSKIETALCRAAAETSAGALSAIYGGEAAPAFSIEGPAASEAGPAAAAITARFLLHLHGYSGEILLGFTAQSLQALQAVKPSAPQPARRESIRQGSAIGNQLDGIDIELTAILAHIELSVGTLESLKPGQVIKLPNRVDTPVTVFSGGECLFTARMGQSAGRYALSVESREKPA